MLDRIDGWLLARAGAIAAAAYAAGTTHPALLLGSIFADVAMMAGLALAMFAADEIAITLALGVIGFVTVRASYPFACVYAVDASARWSAEERDRYASMAERRRGAETRPGMVLALWLFCALVTVHTMSAGLNRVTACALALVLAKALRHYLECAEPPPFKPTRASLGGR